jgi:hypothetical protein
MKQAQEENLAGCCGIYCGLCPWFQSTAPSRCPGCRIRSQSVSCNRYNCCVKKNGLGTCAECGTFPCEKYEKFFDWDSFVSHQPCLSNLEAIRTHGLNAWLKEQGARRKLLEELLADYNEGRSARFYCAATTLMAPEAIEGARAEARRQMARTADLDIKTRAKIVRTALQERATAAGIDLKLRHAAKET